ncbi:DUF6331 family protein [Pelagicoccus sp. SDUM812003]|nr:DUF6331 family protein [Pelagicoccus sp. SDUM812003]
MKSTATRNGGLCASCIKYVYDQSLNPRIDALEIEIGDHLMSFFEESQVHCVIECCGMNAVEVSSATIAAWKKSHNSSEWTLLMKDYQELINELAEIETPVFFLGDRTSPKEVAEFTKQLGST